MKYSFLLLSFLLFGYLSYSQDTIIQRNGSHIPSKVLEIDKNDIKYKRFENLDGPSYLISKADVSLIRYQNGTIDSFNVASVKQNTSYIIVKKPLSEMYLKGQQDAETYYTKYKPAAQWTLGLTLPLNVFGIIPAVAFTATPPRKANLGYPDESLIGNPDYFDGYLATAKNKKAKHVMKNFGLGALGSVVLYGVLLIIAK